MTGQRPCHPACLTNEAMLQDCDIRFVRRSGPGGQHRNKVSSGVQLVHRPTGLVAEANERRSQAQNRAQAAWRLRLMLAVDQRGAGAGESSSELWRQRLRAGRLVISPVHEDFPCLLAEALDMLAVRDWNLRAAAEFAGCSGSQFVRFLALEPRALGRLNAERALRGLRRLSR